VTFFSDDRAAELREIFFESAQELMQTLNEEGLELEKRPNDPEIVRSIRRTVHTLKGDSAACGFSELNELAHELEDVFTPELAAKANTSLAELVLCAADTFEVMLGAYRAKQAPPSGDSLRAIMRELVSPAPKTAECATQQVFDPKFDWTEYERLLIANSAVRGQKVFNVAVALDLSSPMFAAGVQLVRNVMQEAGTVLASRPEEGSTEPAATIEAAIASHHEQAWIEKKCKIPAVATQIRIELCPTQQDEPAPPEPVEQDADESDVLGILDAAAQAAKQSGDLPSIAPHEANASSEEPVKQSGHILAAENIVRVDADRIDTVLDLVGELVIGKSMLHQTLTEFSKRFPKDPLRGRFADAMAFQSQVLNKLQRSVMKIRMVPVEQLFRRFPRVVRDVSKISGKDVELIMQGQETDLDKGLLDTLAEPLTHLVRNAVDHGIESPEERAAAGKPMRGMVRLNAYHQANQVVIEITDDGRGIDRDKVLAKAIEKGVIGASETSVLSDTEIFNLIFRPGFSTADQISSISGRGVGMDVVHNVMDRLKGTVTIDTQPGIGTTFRLKLPLTLAIIKALLFRVADGLYAVPLGSVTEITRAFESDIHRVDRHEVLNLRNETLTLVRLTGLSRHAKAAQKKVFVIVIALAERKFGLIVDRLVGEEELVIKALNDQLASTSMVSGASILGDGTVVLILNISSVVERLGRASLTSNPSPRAQEVSA
jgi:two-component system, chemotaxis family, sensor kinase CheA